MNKQCILFLFVALTMGVSSVSVGKWSKREIDFSDVASPDDYGGVNSSSTSEQSQDSAALLPEQENETASPIAESSDNPCKPENQWAEVLNATSKHLSEAFARYDRAKATCGREIRMLADDIKFFKQTFDTYYNLHKERAEELEKLQCNLRT